MRHRHRVGGVVVERMSELLYINGRPVALLDWINLGGIRTPLYMCELDSRKLKAAGGQHGLYEYDAITVDPRFPNALSDS